LLPNGSANPAIGEATPQVELHRQADIGLATPDVELRLHLPEVPL